MDQQHDQTVADFPTIAAGHAFELLGDIFEIELACPAVHETFAENLLTLPTARLDPERDYTGQRFLWHVAANGRWQPWRVAGFD